jgi:hypothetical protein
VGGWARRTNLYVTWDQTASEQREALDEQYRDLLRHTSGRFIADNMEPVVID